MELPLFEIYAIYLQVYHTAWDFYMSNKMKC